MSDQNENEEHTSSEEEEFDPTETSVFNVEWGQDYRRLEHIKAEFLQEVGSNTDKFNKFKLSLDEAGDEVNNYTEEENSGIENANTEFCPSPVLPTQDENIQEDVPFIAPKVAESAIPPKVAESAPNKKFSFNIPSISRPPRRPK